MEFQCDVKAGADVWTFRGDLRIQDVAILKQQIDALRPFAKKKILDFSEVSACDTAGLQLLNALISELVKSDLRVDIPVWPAPILDVAASLGFKLQGMGGENG